MEKRFRSALIALKAKNFQRAVDFYTKTLGFDLVSQYQQVWAEVRGPGIQFGISAQRPSDEPPGRDTNIVIVFEVQGIEKLYEELLIDGGRTKATKFKKIFIESPTKFDVQQLEETVRELEQAARLNDRMKIYEILKAWFNGYLNQAGLAERFMGDGASERVRTNGGEE